MIHEQASEFVGRRLFGLDGPFDDLYKWRTPGAMYSFLPLLTDDISISTIIKRMTRRGFTLRITVDEKVSKATFKKGAESSTAKNKEWDAAVLLAAHAALSDDND